VYQRGLKRVAMDLDKAPGNLSRELGGESDRHFSVEALERYIQTQGDLTPIYYLIARYMGDQAAAEGATLRRVESLMQEVAALMAKGIRKKMNSTYGIGITGIAGPDGGTKRKPVGLVYVSVSGPKRTKTFQLNLLGTRAEIKFSTAQKAVGFLRLEIISSSRNRARRN
jgi:hypothetical protein